MQLVPIRLFVLVLALLAGLANAQTPQVQIDSATQTASQTVKIQVDVVLPAGSTGTMRFIATDPNGNDIVGNFAPVVTGLNQTFVVLFPAEIPPGSKVRAEVVADPGAAVHSDTVPIK